MSKALYQGLPEIKSGVNLLWHTGYYDGPLSGICLFNEEMHYFDCRRDGHLLQHRFYWICKLFEEEKEKFLEDQREQMIHFGSNNMRYLYTANIQMGKQVHDLWCIRPPPLISKYSANKSAEVVGWCIESVLYGRSWEEWRPHVNRKTKNKTEV